MSLILEALKKSEQQRRLGEAPTLGSPVLASRRRRSLLPFLVGLIALALVAGWWLLRPHGAIAPGSAPTAAAPTPDAAATASPEPAPVGLAPRAAKNPVANRRPARAAAGVDNGQPLPATPRPNDRPGSVAALPQANALTGGPHDVPTASAPPRRTPPAAPSPSAVVPAASPALATAAAPAPRPVPAVAAPPPAAPAQPALPSVWELPYATRKDLPDLHVTMHVYAADPTQRFVVVAGERHVEGDDLGDGVVLRQIRSDGMVLDYKGKRFVYPRDGR